MQQRLVRVLRPTFWVGIVITVASLLFLLLFHSFSALPVGITLFLLLLCAATQIAAFLGGTRFSHMLWWPGLCMLLSVPATLYAGFAGPAVLFGFSGSLLWQILRGQSESLLYYAFLPFYVFGILAALAFLVVAVLWIYDDVRLLFSPEETAAHLDDDASAKIPLVPSEDKTIVATAAAPDIPEAEAEPAGDSTVVLDAAIPAESEPEAPASEDAAPPVEESLPGNGTEPSERPSFKNKLSDMFQKFKSSLFVDPVESSASAESVESAESSSPAEAPLHEEAPSSGENSDKETPDEETASAAKDVPSALPGHKSASKSGKPKDTSPSAVPDAAPSAPPEASDDPAVAPTGEISADEPSLLNDAEPLPNEPQQSDDPDPGAASTTNEEPVVASTAPTKGGASVVASAEDNASAAATSLPAKKKAPKPPARKGRASTASATSSAGKNPNKAKPPPPETAPAKGIGKGPATKQSVTPPKDTSD